jgi:hypothetical protein
LSDLLDLSRNNIKFDYLGVVVKILHVATQWQAFPFFSVKILQDLVSFRFLKPQRSPIKFGDFMNYAQTERSTLKTIKATYSECTLLRYCAAAIVTATIVLSLVSYVWADFSTVIVP